MSQFNGWDEVSFADLLIAYKKAKADSFFESTYPAALGFSKYEKGLKANLISLQQRLLDGSWFDSEDSLGQCRLLPKKLAYKDKKKTAAKASAGHVHFSDPLRSAKHIETISEAIPDFRVVGDFPIDAHVVSALWINFIGHKFDEVLGKNCYGARLRRVNSSEDEEDKKVGDFHLNAVGSFPPYFQAYQRWRSDGLNAIRSELKAGREVIAASLDLKSYYHQIDPSCIAKKTLIDELGVVLSDKEYVFHLRFANYLASWSAHAAKFVKSISAGDEKPAGGLVIGLTASRIVSNAVLRLWDRAVEVKLAPIHYGRYVDDMFIVLRDGGAINDADEFMRHLATQIGHEILLRPEKKLSKWVIRTPGLGKTQISLQADKQKLFILAGRGGLDLLDSIESEIGELSSEHRLLPSPDDLENSPTAQVLTAAGVVGDSADTLRRADGLTIRRLGWAMQLRHVETLARDLPKGEWRDQRKKFYEFARDHVLRPDALFSHFNYVPRLVGFAISLGEWGEAKKLVRVVEKSFSNIEERSSKHNKIVVNGVPREIGESLWTSVRHSLNLLLLDAMMRSFPLSEYKENSFSASAKSFASWIFGSYHEDFGDIIKEAALELAVADLAKTPAKNLLRRHEYLRELSQAVVDEENLLGEALHSAGAVNLLDLNDFLVAANKSLGYGMGDNGKVSRRLPLMPYLFPTRPLSIAEITELAPCCVDPAYGGQRLQRLAKFAQSLRGVWIKKETLEISASKYPGQEGRKSFVDVGKGKKDSIRVAVPSLYVSSADWAGAASNKPRLTSARYSALAKIVNDTIRLDPRPDYLILPELSLPLAWAESVSSRLLSAGISLVAGAEYRHSESKNIQSEAYICLADDRLGFPSSVRIWQPKLMPAVHEEYELISLHDKSWLLAEKRAKPVYAHHGFCFGVMVCSELQNSKERVGFQGEVDSLFVLCWNQDLDTFSSLVDAAALDIHAYTVLVNNRKYGDSRVRSPSKKNHMRDLVRIRGGDNDFVVSVQLNVQSLREFQSRAKRWPKVDDKFKPVPEGFSISSRRKTQPS
ncbi:RNA-directed DNA polymerase [Xanthomonas campestris]|uniref:RNA-directed DNA polymerase n=1 Tax=Xanthomonas campestris TaxID=339 RepID=UPI0011BD89A6|nr:RNA-directed DNA polymerase [Xanthomonas campestris]TXD40584.1 RNA-directed DNA polymerase [Xanthomonas campestris]